MSISLRPIQGVYYDKGIVILKRDKRSDIFIVEPEMFCVLISSDFNYCLGRKWICLKPEDGSNLEHHMEAFFEAARTIFFNDGTSKKHMNRWLKKVAKQRKRRIALKRLAAE